MNNRERLKKLISRRKPVQTTQAQASQLATQESQSSSRQEKLRKLFSRKKQAQSIQVQEPILTTSTPKTDKTRPTKLKLPSEESATAPSTKGTEIIETYPLNEPYAYAKIVKIPSRGNITYVVEEPQLDETDILNLQRLTTLLNEVLEFKITELKSKKAAEEYLLKKCDELITHYNFKLNPQTKNKLLYYIVRDNLGLGKIDPFMHDPLIEDVSCDGINVTIYIWHRKYESIPTNIRFETADELDDYTLD